MLLMDLAGLVLLCYSTFDLLTIQIYMTSKCPKYMKPRSIIQKSKKSATIPHNTGSRGFEDY